MRVRSLWLLRERQQVIAASGNCQRSDQHILVSKLPLVLRPSVLQGICQA
jgi:hypothetical protein